MKRSSLVIVTGLIICTGALAQDVQYNYDTAADFSKYKTYTWVDVPGGDKIDPLAAKQVKAALEEALAAKGLSKAESGKSDLAAAYRVAITAEKQLTLTGTGHGLPARWGGMGTVRGNTSTIPVGALALSMFDVATKELVWQGVITKQLDPHASPEKREKNLKKGFAKLLKDFPPKE